MKLTYYRPKGTPHIEMGTSRAHPLAVAESAVELGRGTDAREVPRWTAHTKTAPHSELSLVPEGV